MLEKYLLVMRHAKSDWSVAGQSDFDRELNSRGIKAAPKMGAFLRNSGNSPSVILSSPARRAMLTSQLVADSLEFEKDTIQYNRDLYYGDVEDYYHAMRAIDDNEQIALMVGHNPLGEHFIGFMCEGKTKSLVQMPTAGIACIEFYGETWEHFNPGSGQLKWFMIPKLLS